MNKGIKSGGEAFPVAASEEQSYVQCGMTIRDYFAAHAPPMPEWWEKRLREPVEPREGPTGFTGEKLHFWQGWGDYVDDKDIKPEWLAEFKERLQKRQDEKKKFKAELQAARMKHFIAWRWAYADAMIQSQATAKE